MSTILNNFLVKFSAGDVSIEWLQGHVRDAAQETFRCFAHIGSEHVDQVARSVLTDPASYESSSNGVLPCVKSHAQLASLMVKYSFANRLRHLSRALPKEIVGDVLKDVEKLTVATYEGLLGDDLHLTKSYRVASFSRIVSAASQ